MTGKCDKKDSAVVWDGLLYRHEIKIMKVWDDFMRIPCTVGATSSALLVAP